MGRVMGVVLDNLTNNVYSISEDKHFKIQDILKNEVIADLQVGNSGLTNMVFDKEFKRIFIANRSGNVFLYDVSAVIEFNILNCLLIYLIIEIKIVNADDITHTYYCWKRNYKRIGV